MIENTGHADGAFCEGIERGIGKGIAVAVNFVVAEHEIEHIDLIERVFASGKLIEQGEQFLLILHSIPPSEKKRPTGKPGAYGND